MRAKRMAALVLAASMLVVGGCSKRVPSTEANFSAAANMVVTFRDGEQLIGRMADGEQVTYVTFGRVYRATIQDVGPPDFVLTDAYVQGEYDRFGVQRDRLENAELYIRDQTTEIRIPRYKIVSVEQVQFDKVVSARNAVFWGFTTFILSQILSARL